MAPGMYTSGHNAMVSTVYTFLSTHLLTNELCRMSNPPLGLQLLYIKTPPGLLPKYSIPPLQPPADPPVLLMEENIIPGLHSPVTNQSPTQHRPHRTLRPPQAMSPAQRRYPRLRTPSRGPRLHHMSRFRCLQISSFNRPRHAEVPMRATRPRMLVEHFPRIWYAFTY